MNYHEYETIYITRPELPEGEMERLDTKFAGIIEQGHGTVLVREDWGRRKLAYDISKHAHGHYIYLNYVGPAELPSEFERNLRLEDPVIRFLSVKLEEYVDLEERRVLAEERHERRTAQLDLVREPVDEDDDSEEDTDDTTPTGDDK